MKSSTMHHSYFLYLNAVVSLSIYLSHKLSERVFFMFLYFSPRKNLNLSNGDSPPKEISDKTSATFVSVVSFLIHCYLCYVCVFNA